MIAAACCPTPSPIAYRFQHATRHRTGAREAASGATALMEYKVRHRTTYRYLQDVAQSWHLAHLLLRGYAECQQVLASHVTLTPGCRQPGSPARRLVRQSLRMVLLRHRP